MNGKATKIEWRRFDTPQMRAFHMSWFAFFLCFFAWFGVAPLMATIREELALTPDQIGWSIIASVAITVVARLGIGWLCDRIGPRLCYTGLLAFGSIPVMAIGLAHDFESFLVCRLLIGAIGASFVITQVHTAAMFAPNCVGTANATTAGWGNLGGGITQIAMPALFTVFVSLAGVSAAAGWRLCMVVAGAACLTASVAYFVLTQDTPEGNLSALRASRIPGRAAVARGGFADALRDRRVWILFALYGACFGVELTLHNVASLYFLDNFDEFAGMSRVRAIGTAGTIAGLFGTMALFARTLGGLAADRVGQRLGLAGRVRVLFAVLLGEGLMLIVFSRMTELPFAVAALIGFGIFVHMSAGATFAIVPFVRREAVGAVAGIVGAGGNVGAVAAGFLFKEMADWSQALFVLGLAVAALSVAALGIRFPVAVEAEVRAEAASLLGRAA